MNITHQLVLGHAQDLVEVAREALEVAQGEKSPISLNHRLQKIEYIAKVITSRVKELE